MARLAHALRLEKESARRHPTLAEPYDGPRCAETGDRPAERDARLSRFAEMHRARGAHEKRELEQARTFDEISSDGWVAYICVDGAGIGSLVAGLRTLREYVETSAALTKAFTLDADDLLGMGCRKDRFQLVLSGGDDLLLVVPAKAKDDQVDAFSLTGKLCQHIESRFAAHAPSETRRIGVGAGVVIAKGLAASFAFDHARALCNRAKKALPGALSDASATSDRSAVDYEVIGGGAPLSGSLDDVRPSVKVKNPLGRSSVDLVLTRRPYTLSRWEALIQRARKLAGMEQGETGLARSQRLALRRVFRKDRDVEEGLVDLLYQASRHPELRRLLEIDLLAMPPSEWVMTELPDGRWATSLGDLVEVSRLLEGGR
jgi:hypothetical protein